MIMLKKKHKILIGLTFSLIVLLIAIPLFAKQYLNNNFETLIGRNILMIKSLN